MRRSRSLRPRALPLDEAAPACPVWQSRCPPGAHHRPVPLDTPPCTIVMEYRHPIQPGCLPSRFERQWSRSHLAGCLNAAAVWAAGMCSISPPDSATGTHPPQSGGYARMRHHPGDKCRGAGMLDRAPFTAVQFSACPSTGPLEGGSIHEV
jgi:hypothetical protein